MVAACPKCSARYRVDPARIGPEGARLKCAKCEAVFRVRAPAQPAPAEPVAVPSAPPAAPEAVASPPPTEPQAVAPVSEAPAQPEAPEPQPAADPARLVVVADPEVESGKHTVAALRSWGLEPILVHDGVEAILTIQRMLPRAVVLDAALPKMYGFQVCELVKRNESLRSITVALVGAIHHKDRYRRPPSDLYGADTYLERPDLPEGLVPILRSAGFEFQEGGPTPEPAPTIADPAVAAAPVPVPSAPENPTPAAAPPAADPAPASDGLDEDRVKAERLARIIVSDIVLYAGDKFTAAVAAGNVVEALDGDLAEGRALFIQRIDARVREGRDFLVEELERVARERESR